MKQERHGRGAPGGRDWRQAVTAGAVTAALFCAAWLAPLRAATYLDVDCSCDPKTQSNWVNGLEDDDGNTAYGCICGQSYTLGKLATKEFRFHCRHENANPEAGFVSVADRDKPTTCTIDVILPGTKTISKSCTNWSTLSTDSVKLDTLCVAK